MDYKRLDNPFSDEDDDEDAMIVIQMMINDESYNAALTTGLSVSKKRRNHPIGLNGRRRSKLSLNNSGTWVPGNLSKAARRDPHRQQMVIRKED
jgi:hypothetical protein